MGTVKGKRIDSAGARTAARGGMPPVSINKVMELSGYSRSYIYKLVRWKKIPAYRPTNGRLFFCESEILEFLSRNRQAADYEVSERADAILNGEGI
jgi:predicted DNA-binding transcriptional regulator AlpA